MTSGSDSDTSRENAENDSAQSGFSDPIRTRLLEAAAEVFGERGYDGARVQEIARRADLTTGAIYNRFRGKDDLLIAAVSESVALDAVFDDPRASSPTDILGLLGHEVLEDDSEGAGARMFIEAAAASGRERDLGQMLLRLMEDERSRIAKLVDQAKTDGLFDESLDTDAVAKFCQAIGLGFCMFRGLGVELPEAGAWDHVISTVISAALPGADTSDTSPSSPDS